MGVAAESPGRGSVALTSKAADEARGAAATTVAANLRGVAELLRRRRQVFQAVANCQVGSSRITGARACK